MISPFKNAGSAIPPSPRTSRALNGLYGNGVWHCNCDPRLPAARLQTKNHGKNHGRWFYTCQKPPGKQCKFFLWASDAEIREKEAILANSHSEPHSGPGAGPQTPSRPTRQYGTGLLTPQTDRPIRNGPVTRIETPSRSAKARMMSEGSDEFEWDDAADKEDFNALLSQPPRQPDFTQSTTPASQSFYTGDFTYSPRKTPRTDSFSTPGKRKFGDMEYATSQTPTSVFSSRTTQSETMPPPSFDISSTPTPSKYRNALSADPGEPSDLALEAIKILESHGAVVPRRAQEELSTLLNRQDLKMKGIIRGRDISRVALKKKDHEIAMLNEKIASLMAEEDVESTIVSGSSSFYGR